MEETEVGSTATSAEEKAGASKLKKSMIKGHSRLAPITERIKQTKQRLLNAALAGAELRLVPMMGILTFTFALSAAAAPSVPVTIVNPPTTPAQVTGDMHDADNPANNPARGFLCSGRGTFFTQCNPSGTPPGTVTFTVPATIASGQLIKRLVIEYVSGNCSSLVGQSVVGFELFSSWSSFNANFVPVNVSIPNPSVQYTYAFAQQTRLYASPTETLQMGLSLGGPSLGSDYYCFLAFSGYYVLQ